MSMYVKSNPTYKQYIDVVLHTYMHTSILLEVVVVVTVVVV